MAQVISQEQIYSADATMPATWKSYLPAILAIAGSLGMLLLRLQMGQSFISDGALMMISLACYILGALFLLTNLYAPSEMARKIGFSTAAFGRVLQPIELAGPMG